MNAWNEPAPVLKGSLFSHELFETFLTSTEMEKICVESTNYAGSEGNHIFTMTVQKLKVFFTILLVSGSARLPKQEMHWERREVCHNLVVSSMMEKN